MSDDLQSHLDAGTESWSEDVPSPQSEEESARWRVNPAHVAYLMGPAAFVVILLLMRFNLVVHESAWLWLAVFIAIPAASLVADQVYRSRPTEIRLHARVVVQVAAVTAVIYLSGWGPVLSGAYAFLALENVAHGGSRVLAGHCALERGRYRGGASGP